MVTKKISLLDFKNFKIVSLWYKNIYGKPIVVNYTKSILSTYLVEEIYALVTFLKVGVVF
jgi:hypothetical protein